MLLQRSLVLALGLFLFIVGFIIYFRVADARLEDNFQHERQKFNVDGKPLTALIPDAPPAEPPASAPAPAPVAADATPAPVSVPTTTTLPNSAAVATPDAPAPGTAPGSATAPSPALAPDPNVIIGPVPPPTASTPDNTSASATPAPATPDSAPAATTPDNTTTAPPAPAPATPDSTSAMPAAPAAPDSTSPAPANPTPATPDNTPPAPAAPAPATPDNTPSSPVVPIPPSTPDKNSTPMAPTTMLLPRGMNSLALLALTAADGLRVQIPGVEQPAPPPAPAAPALGSPIVITPSPSGGNSPTLVMPTTNTVEEPATNAAPSALAPVGSEIARPVAVEASVIVLLYHQFVPAGVKIPSKLQWTMNQDVFEAEMKYIHDNGYHVVPMSDLQKFLRHEIGLPPNSVVITIDDGYKSAIVYAAPILKKYGYPWTFFIYPAFITVAEGHGAASWNDLLALQAEGIDIECHSMTHPQLPKHGNKSPEEYDKWLTNETAGAKAILEQKLGKTITCFAYPYGAYNKQVEAKVIDAGFQYIFTVNDNPVHASTDPHSIGRYTITQAVEKAFTAYLRQGALSVTDANPPPGGTTNNPRPVISAVLGYTGTLDPKSLETTVRDYGLVKHDYDPKTSTVRLYLPRDLIQQTNLVNIRIKDAETGQTLVANWHFNFEPAGAATAAHAPISSSTATNAPAAPAVPNVAPVAPPVPVTEPATSTGATGTPMEVPTPAPAQ
jgi:peptidoglycan/xylan/chitin deacetylase (PgdA/CDA1 family)